MTPTIEQKIVEMVGSVSFLLIVSYVFSVLYLFGYCFYFNLSLREIPISLIDITQNLIKVGPYIFILYLLFFLFSYSFFYIEILISSIESDLKQVKQIISEIQVDELLDEANYLVQETKKLEKNKHSINARRSAKGIMKRLRVLESKIEEKEALRNQLTKKHCKSEKKIKLSRYFLRFIYVISWISLITFIYYLFFPLNFWWESYIAIFAYIILFVIFYLRFVDATNIIAQIMFVVLFSYIFFISAGYIDAKKASINIVNKIEIKTKDDNYMGTVILCLNQGIIISIDSERQFISWNLIEQIKYGFNPQSSIPMYKTGPESLGWAEKPSK